MRGQVGVASEVEDCHSDSKQGVVAYPARSLQSDGGSTPLTAGRSSFAASGTSFADVAMTAREIEST